MERKAHQGGCNERSLARVQRCYAAQYGKKSHKPSKLERLEPTNARHPRNSGRESDKSSVQAENDSKWQKLKYQQSCLLALTYR